MDLLYSRGMQDAAVIEKIGSRYMALGSMMDERLRRQWAAVEARSYGWGGVRAVSHATGISPNTIVRGLAELEFIESHPEIPRPEGCVVRAAGASARSRPILICPR